MTALVLMGEPKAGQTMTAWHLAKRTVTGEARPLSEHLWSIPLDGGEWLQPGGTRALLDLRRLVDDGHFRGEELLTESTDRWRPIESLLCLGPVLVAWLVASPTTLTARGGKPHPAAAARQAVRAEKARRLRGVFVLRVDTDRLAPVEAASAIRAVASAL